MPLPLTAAVLLCVSYLVGAIPFGYLLGRLRGIDLFRAGSGNIGATNAARVLGARFGILVFVLDFLKGAVPCAVVVPLARALSPGADGLAVWLRVGAAALAFLGHLFPVYLRFRGGKGVATGAGTIFVLVPGPAALAILFWAVVLLASRTVSLASLAALGVLIVAYLLGADDAVGENDWPVTVYLLTAVALVIVKHRANVARLVRGSENTIREFGMRQTILRGLHVLALGFWFGGAGFFSFLAAPPIFASFRQVVYDGPSDRTAYETIIPANADSAKKDALASALAGSAVGPVFPRFFAMQAVCGLIALVTAASWWRMGGVNRLRVYLLAVALITVGVGWPISQQVSELRLLRFSRDGTIATAAKKEFGTWHVVSLLLSFVTIILAGVSLALASRLPAVMSVAKSKEAEKSKAGL